MRIVGASPHRYALPLVAEWRSAAGNLAQRCGWLLQLETEDGRLGYGECAPLPSHGTEDEAAALNALQHWQTRLPGAEAADALEWLGEAEAFACPAARCAVETALLDLLAQGANRSILHCIRQCQCGDEVAVNAMLGDALSVTPAMLGQTVDAGFSVIKLKLGIGSPEQELAALQSLAKHLPADCSLRLDANRAWDQDTAKRMLEAFAALPIESLEEPLANPDLETLAALQASVSFPLALDESWPQLNPKALFANPPVRRLVLKLAPLGGLLPALTLAQRAAAAALECVVTTGIDSACGTLAAAHLAAAIAIPGATPLAHGLATSSWLAEDTGESPAIVRGRLQLPAHTGLGFKPYSRLQF